MFKHCKCKYYKYSFEYNFNRNKGNTFEHLKPTYKMKIRTLVFLLFSLLLSSCIERYDAAVGYEEKLLVVDAFISNAEGPYSVSLTYSSSNITDLNDYITGAKVKIIDNDGREYMLNHTQNGIYKTPFTFRALIGNTYKLHIENNANTYESEPCQLREPSNIDSLYFTTGTAIITNQEIPVLQLRVDASVCSDEETYLRWEINENWRTFLQRPETLIMTDDTTFTSKENIVYHCYKSSKINSINIYSFQNLNENQITAKNIASFSTAANDKFTQRYRAEILQYSISKDEYNFWSRLKQTSDEGNNFFGKQPFGVKGNMKCINDPNKDVLGFFQVAGLSSKEIYINKSEIGQLDLPVYSSYNQCPFDTVLASTQYSLFDKYKERQAKGIWGFYSPHWDETNTQLLGLIFTKVVCIKCSAGGASEYPPEGWQE